MFSRFGLSSEEEAFFLASEEEVDKASEDGLGLSCASLLCSGLDGEAVVFLGSDEGGFLGSASFFSFFLHTMAPKRSV